MFLYFGYNRIVAFYEEPLVVMDVEIAVTDDFNVVLVENKRLNKQFMPQTLMQSVMQVITLVKRLFVARGMLLASPQGLILF